MGNFNEMRAATAWWTLTTAILAALEKSLVTKALTKEERRYLDNAIRNLTKLQTKLEEDAVDIEARVLKEMKG